VDVREGITDKPPKPYLNEIKNDLEEKFINKKR
jgi:hypothetical protein